MVFEPTCSGTDVVQFVNPFATPLRFIWSFSHLTCVTPTLSDVVPLSASDEALIAYVEALVGEEIVTVGRVVSVPPVGGGVVPPPVDVVMFHVNVSDVLNTPSEARAVTAYVPAVVPVPEI